MRQKYSKNSSGFTLLELIIVIIIMALVFAVGIPRIFKGLDSTKSRNVLNDIVLFLREARMDALTTGKRIKVKIKLEDGFFKAENGKIFSIPKETDFRLKAEDKYLYVETTETGFTFFPNGMAAGANIVILSGDNKIAQITLDPLTGLANYRLELNN